MALFDVWMFFTIFKKIETNAIHLPGFWSPNSSWRGRVTYTYQVFLISPSFMNSGSHVWRSSNISLSKSLHMHYSTTVFEVVIIISISQLRNLNFKWKSQREYSNPVLTKVSTQAFNYCTISKFLTLRQNGGVDWQGNRLGVSPDSYHLGSDKMAKNLPLSEWEFQLSYAPGVFIEISLTP